MDLGLKDKVAVVTGGSVGIGLAVANGLAAEGVDVVIAARGAERVSAEAARIAATHRVKALGVACDVATRAGTDHLIAVILHTASICAVQPLWYEPIYNTTKAALLMFSKTLATELIGDNIRVNTVNPGLILTPDWIKTAKQLTADKGGDWQAYLDGIAKENTPIKRFASPEELANFYVFLCSERASYCVGSSYFVDGGWLKTV